MTTARRLTAELVGTFALVFAGCGAVMVEAKTGALGHVGVFGASMNPARSIGPAFVSGDLHALWLHILAPIAGAALGAVVYQSVRGEPTHPARGTQ